MSFSLSRKAKNDLREIWHYTFEHWSEEQADSFIGSLRERIEYIASNPEKGREFYHRNKTYRFVQVKSQLIFWKEAARSEIEVIRILHKSMDIANRLSD